MYFTNSSDGSVDASAVIVHEVISPKVAGSSPEGPWMDVTTPLFLARNAGSSLHSGQVGRASFRSPAISSRMKLDQMSMAPCPAKYPARVVSTSCAPLTE